MPRRGFRTPDPEGFAEKALAVNVCVVKDQAHLLSSVGVEKAAKEG